MDVIEGAILKQIGLDAIEAAKMQKVAEAAHAQGMTAGAQGLANMIAAQAANSNPQIARSGLPVTNTNNATVGQLQQEGTVVNGRQFTPAAGGQGLAANSNRWWE